MHIILVSNHMATAKTLSITPARLLLAGAVFVLLSFATSFLFSWIGIRFNMPFASDLVASVQQMQNRKSEEYLKDNIRAMAVKLGELQAQLIRLDILGERVSKISGVNLQKSDAEAKGGQGGPLVPSSRPLDMHSLQQEIAGFAEVLEQRADELVALESQLMERRIKATLLPTITPIEANYMGSPFGRRVDPIAGISAMHEGIDFVAEIGTRVLASAGGVVTVSEFHPQYGKLIEIDHGNDFSSRYAHLSKADVKVGQIVRRGQLIGASGNTGRSTGPHLHFEVRFKGIAQNPARFLKLGAAPETGQRLAQVSSKPAAPRSQRSVQGR